MKRFQKIIAMALAATLAVPGSVLSTFASARVEEGKASLRRLKMTRNGRIISRPTHWKSWMARERLKTCPPLQRIAW